MPLWLAGCGTPQQEANVWRRAFDGVARVTYWLFALSAERLPEAPAWLRSALHEPGIRAEVDTWSSLQGRDPHSLADVELVFVGGGMTSRLLRHLHDHDFVQPLRDLVRDGGRYYGGSAGALVACESIAVAAPGDGDLEAADAPPGLGLMRGATILPHANSYSPAQVAEWAAEYGPLVAVPQACGLEVAGSSVHVLGPGDAALVRSDDARILTAGTTVNC